jgi:hypothetical protein
MYYSLIIKIMSANMNYCIDSKTDQTTFGEFLKLPSVKFDSRKYYILLDIGKCDWIDGFAKLITFKNYLTKGKNSIKYTIPYIDKYEVKFIIHNTSYDMELKPDCNPDTSTFGKLTLTCNNDTIKNNLLLLENIILSRVPENFKKVSIIKPVENNDNIFKIILSLDPPSKYHFESDKGGSFDHRTIPKSFVGTFEFSAKAWEINENCGIKLLYHRGIFESSVQSLQNVKVNYNDFVDINDGFE